jgi:hypothetical protein
LIRNTRAGVGPGNGLSVCDQFQRLAYAGTIGPVHAATNLGTDCSADDRANDDGNRPVGVTRDLGPKHSPGESAEYRPDLAAVTAAGLHALV